MLMEDGRKVHKPTVHTDAFVKKVDSLLKKKYMRFILRISGYLSEQNKPENGPSTKSDAGTYDAVFISQARNALFCLCSELVFAILTITAVFVYVFGDGVKLDINMFCWFIIAVLRCVKGISDARYESLAARKRSITRSGGSLIVTNKVHVQRLRIYSAILAVAFALYAFILILIVSGMMTQNTNSLFLFPMALSTSFCALTEFVCNILDTLCCLRGYRPATYVLSPRIEEPYQ